jgi:phosphopantothenoylcysteine synthetase/decarboxylase
VVAPCSAHFLAKVAHGLCDDLLSCVVRAWPPDKRILLQPVMHQSIWRHPLTKQHLANMSQQPNVYFLLSEGQLRSEADVQAGCSACITPEVTAIAVRQCCHMA